MSRVTIYDAYGRPVEIKLERKSLGFVPQSLPAEQSEPPTGVAQPIQYGYISRRWP